MQIKVTDKQQTLKKSKAGKAYTELTVFFEKDGEAKSRKLTSYDKVNFPFFKDLSNGTVVNVETFQDDAGFWNWKNPEKVSVAGKSEANAPNNYKANDDLRQLRIVRQACLKAASEQKDNYDDTIALAEKYVTWVLALPGAPKAQEVEEDGPVEDEGVE